MNQKVSWELGRWGMATRNVMKQKYFWEID